MRYLKYIFLTTDNSLISMPNSIHLKGLGFSQPSFKHEEIINGNTLCPLILEVAIYATKLSGRSYFLVFHFLMKTLNLLYFNQQFLKIYILHSFSERAMSYNYIIASSTNKGLLPAMKPQICWKVPAFCRMYKDHCSSNFGPCFFFVVVVVVWLCGCIFKVHLTYFLIMHS